MEKVQDCKNWLVRFLSVNGETDCKTVSVIAAKMGYTKTVLRAARAEAGVKTRHEFNHLAGTSKWVWYLER